MSRPLVAIIFQHGAFTAADTARVATVQSCYLLQTPFYLIGILGVRLLSALKLNRALMWIGFVNAIVNIAADYAFMKLWGLPGIALSTSLVYVCAMIVVLVTVARALKRQP
jgi:putative peptidoglycan lipid II flippase